MQIHGPSQVHGAQGVNGPHSQRGSSSRPAQSTAGPADQLDISPAAEVAASAAEGGEIRSDLVARVRSEIAAGTYETPDKMAAALDRLVDEIG
jgi:negative regulator of flagellin synthesis FlgM